MELVDWNLAGRVGRRVAGNGPDVAMDEARHAVAGLQRSARRAVAHVADVSGLHPPSQDNTAVVDRGLWIDSNLAGLGQVIEPLGERLAQRGGSSAAARSAGAKVSGVQLGAALGWVSGKVLGQYEVFTGAGQSPRLLLVAPNIVAAQRAMDLPEDEFQLWVCLHEEAHRVQFGATPWLADHFAAEVNTFLMAAEVSAGESVKRLIEIAKAFVQVLAGDDDASLVQAVQNPAQREVFARLSALMSLLEGHAEWVMDAVGTEVLPSLGRMRGRFEQRRSNPGPADGLLRRLMGMDAKLQQYTGGRAFVTDVVNRVGVDGLNRVWESPALLPTLSEISAPGEWVARVHGAAA